MVASDTSPINYLVLIGEVDLLRVLFGTVTIPVAVRDELSSLDAPPAVRAWMAEPPEWLVVFHARRSDDPRLATLDRGEREALALALESSAELMLIDERDARAVAERCGLKVAGTLRVLRDAAHLNLIDLRAALHRLQQTSFRVSPRLIEAVLRELAC